MASIFKRKNTKGKAIWYVNYMYRGRRVKKRIGPSKKVAQDFCNDIAAKIVRDESGLYVNDISREEFVKEMRSYIKMNYRPTTEIRYTEALDYLDAFMVKQGIHKLSGLTPIFFERYKAHRTTGKRKVKGTTVNNELKIIKALLNLAVEWEYLRRNPMAKVKPMPKPAPTIPRFFSQTEAERILGASPQPYRDIFATLLLSGMRRNELRFLQGRDVDFQRRRILIRKKLGFAPKTLERTIPLHDALAPILSSRYRGGEGLFYPTSSGKPYAENYWWKNLKKVLRSLEIQDATIHTFRHTFASWAVMSGVDLRTVQRLLGHSNIQTTMIYAHLSEDHLDDAVNKIQMSPSRPELATKKEKPSQVIDL